MTSSIWDHARARTALGEVGRALAALRWVQGPGGNVSVKTDDGSLLVKASGKRLIDVANDDGHVTVPLELVGRALDSDAEADTKLFAFRPRPSLEAYFHALGPRFVVHTHALGALLHACAGDTANDDLGGLLRQIPYVRPGRGVAIAVREVLGAGAGEAAVLLRNHGLIVYAESAERALALTRAIDEAARARFGALPTIEDALARLRGTGDDVSDEASGVVVRRIAARAVNAAGAGAPARYLFPDAVVCGSALPVDAVPPADAALVRLASEASKALGGRAGVVVDPSGARAAFAKSGEQLAQTIELLAAHEWVEDALASRGTCNYLPDDEPALLASMPSEQYRIRLAAAQREPSPES
jgi:ribulose-5-phosphate 4-epimerase/fuculose-1-phosphate aldolase